MNIQFIMYLLRISAKYYYLMKTYYLMKYKYETEIYNKIKFSNNYRFYCIYFKKADMRKSFIIQISTA